MKVSSKLATRRAEKESLQRRKLPQLPPVGIPLLIRKGECWYWGEILKTTSSIVAVRADDEVKEYKRSLFASRWLPISASCPAQDLIDGPYSQKIALAIAGKKRPPKISPNTWAAACWEGRWHVGIVRGRPFRPPRGRHQLPGIAILIEYNDGEISAVEPANKPVYIKHKTPYLLTGELDPEFIEEISTRRSPLPRPRTPEPPNVPKPIPTKSPEVGDTVIAAAPDRWGDRYRIGEIIDVHSALDGRIVQMSFPGVEASDAPVTLLGYPKVVVEFTPIAKGAVTQLKKFTRSEAKRIISKHRLTRPTG